MPRPKTGTIVIKQEEGKRVAYVRNQGGQEFLAEGLGDILRDFQEKACTFTAKAGKVQQVSVGGTTYSFDRAPEPELKASGSYQKRKPMAGTNLFSGNPKSLRLPKDTAHHVQQLFNQQKGKAKPQLDNFALLLNKSVHFGEIGRQNKPEFLEEHLSDGKAKPFIFRQSFDDRSGNGKVPRKFEIEFDFPQDLIDHTNRRQQAVRDAWKAAGWQVRSAAFTPDFRLIMGLGTASVFETSLTLHHIYGLPYLPASSIKGVTRSWVIVNYFLPEFLEKDKANEKAEKANEKAEQAAMADPLFAYLFGSDTNGPGKKAHRGHITFFDAFPQSPPVIEPDIMNVHYPDWYSKGKAPTDTQSPNPIPFLTIGKCDADQKPLQVRFDLAARENPSCEKVQKEAEAKSEKGDTHNENKLLQSLGIDPQTDILQVAHHLLTAALTSHGIGAKTAIGYGFFQAPSTP